MKDQAKLERMLKVLHLLSGSFGYKINEISNRINASDRTIYRYFETFRNVGFIIEKNNDGYWKIDKEESKHRDLHELLHFSEEESYVLQRAIHSIDDNNALKSNLISKLYSLYNSERIIDTIIKKENSEVISNLTDAILNKKQVRIIGYKSANSSSITDRIVEPIKFTTNFVSIWCYEKSSEKNKLFKTSRIEKIELLENKWEFESKHQSGIIDCFRISGSRQIPVELRLTMRAKNLLIEEYPLSEKYIKKIRDSEYIFEGEVCDYMGIGRFVLGLIDDIEIIKPQDFKEYLNNRIKNNKF